MNDRGTLARQAALVVVTFVATLALLLGGAVLLGQRSPHGPADGGAAASPAAAPSSGGSAAAESSAANPSGSPLASGEIPTIVITGAGDIADCASDGAKQTSDLLLQQGGSFFTAGDNADEDGSPANYAGCYAPTWGRVLDRTILPAAGEHDWQTTGASGYLGYFGTRAAPAGVTWYSTDLEAWHIVVLDSDCDRVGGCDAASPQGKWLASDLARSTASCTLAIWHQPRFSSGEHGDDAAVGPFWELLHEHRAELVINGHDHDYERFAPQDPTGRLERPGGVREIVVGTGGAGLGQFPRSAPNSEFRIAGEWGVLRLTLHPAKYDWEFLPAGTSQIADGGSTPCH